jgi:ferredoxin-NADP reductase
MGRAANGNWPEGQLLVVRHARRCYSLLNDTQAEAQERIGVTLQAMYAALLQQPLSPRLNKLIRQIDSRLETSRHAS